MLKSVCVFCGSMPGASPAYAEAATALGGLLARNGITLVYGGGATGLMGIVAGAVLAAGGRAIGVVPRPLMGPRVRQDLTELRIVEDFAQRLQAFADLSDGFIALPGALGTFEEIFRMAVAEQLRFQKKPTVLLNVEGFWDPMDAVLAKAAEAGFLRPQHRDILSVVQTPQEALEVLERRIQMPPANPF